MLQLMEKIGPDNSMDLMTGMQFAWTTKFILLLYARLIKSSSLYQSFGKGLKFLLIGEATISHLNSFLLSKWSFMYLNACSPHFPSPGGSYMTLHRQVTLAIECSAWVAAGHLFLLDIMICFCVVGGGDDAVVVAVGADVAGEGDDVVGAGVALVITVGAAAVVITALVDIVDL